MKSFTRIGIAVAALAVGLLLPATMQVSRAAGAPWVTGYYASYSEFPPSSMPPSEFDYSALTHVIHWPVVPLNNGTLVDPDTYGLTTAQSAEVVSRAHAAGTKALLGFGGDAASVGDGWHGATLPANRASFIANMVALMQARGYDGIDINWEDLAPADEPQFIAFIQQLRAALDAIAPRPLLTWVPTTGDLPPIAVTAATMDYFDQINLQTYVMSGPYDGWVTWFNSPIYNGGATFPSTGGPLPSADAEIDRYVAAGIPVERLGLGIQFDGFVWAGGSGTPTGGVAAPRQDFNDANPPTMTVLRYADILTQFTPAMGCQTQFDAVARVPWIGCNRPLNANDRFVSFDDEQAIQEKAQYIAQKGMGGVFVFELSGDFFPGATGDARHPLLAAVKQEFRSPTPAGLQPPTGLTATSVVANTVAIAWSAPASGITPTGYVLEGGISPGEVLASIPTGSTATSYTFTAPTGAFYIRMHSVAGAQKSAASNEIRIFVNVPAPPSAPSNLLGMVNGSQLALSWGNTATGGAPTEVLLTVAGTINTSLPLAVTETFSYSSVPPGTYTFTVSSVNGSGTSAPSNAVSLTFPGQCSGAPATPTSFQATKDGSTITVNWGPPASGPAVTLYTMNVAGAFVGSIPTTGRSLAGTVGPGSYTISVTASNPCGASAATPPQTVTIP